MSRTHLLLAPISSSWGWSSTVAGRISCDSLRLYSFMRCSRFASTTLSAHSIGFLPHWTLANASSHSVAGSF
ncbi:hypothetical protein GCK32_019173 [Trichostrongylus colubriformis]|uniref:Uncharacterized protein n=1 Tax=Trichostrongylus colubriformis TaxID=6319 RepID=A0AAN8IPH9_TRICO